MNFTPAKKIWINYLSRSQQPYFESFAEMTCPKCDGKTFQGSDELDHFNGMPGFKCLTCDVDVLICDGCTDTDAIMYGDGSPVPFRLMKCLGSNSGGGEACFIDDDGARYPLRPYMTKEEFIEILTFLYADGMDGMADIDIEPGDVHSHYGFEVVYYDRWHTVKMDEFDPEFVARCREFVERLADILQFPPKSVSTENYYKASRRLCRYIGDKDMYYVDDRVLHMASGRDCGDGRPVFYCDHCDDVFEIESY